MIRQIRFALTAFVVLYAAFSVPIALYAQAGVAALPPVWPQPAPPTPRPANTVTVVRAGRLFDPRSGTMQTNQIIVIRGDRIVDVGGSAAVPDGAKVIDLSGSTVLPGLIDTHLHVMDGNPLPRPPGASAANPNTASLQFHELVALVNAQNDLNAGFTSVVDLMSHGGWYGTVDLRNAINAGLVRGPRMQVAGPGIVDTNRANTPYNPLNPGPIAFVGAQVANGIWEVREAVREQAHYGVDWIKIYSTEDYSFKPDGTMVHVPTFTLEETQAIVDEAHRKGLKVACHAYGGEGLHNCISAGVDVPTHGIDLDDASLRMLLEKHLPLTSTFFDLSIDDGVDKGKWGYSRWDLMQKSWNKALKAGVTLPFGSGAGPFPHGAQINQFAYMVKWGMTPAQALQAATSVAAKLIGWEDQVGTVEKGKFADLIAVPGNPLTDITEIQKVRFVMKGGEVIRNDN